MSDNEFQCPVCERKHNRGFFGSPDNYRCLNCGYVGHGIHPDPEIDAAIGVEIRANQAWNVAHGLPAGEFAP